MDTIPIQYRFLFADGRQENFNLQLDAETLALPTCSTDEVPSWAHLEFHQCPHCALDQDRYRFCPLALCLAPILRRFHNFLSYEEVQLEVITRERVISHGTTVQRGIGSLMGLVIVASGCPSTAFFRPMARFHLPLATEEETVYRTTAMYLLAQYFCRQAGRRADLNFEGLSRIYRDIQTVNSSVAKRIRAAGEGDSAMNAIICLDMYAKTLPQTIQKAVEDLRYLFRPYLEPADGTEEEKR